jgi:uncharacterized protein (TIGR01777 family)
VKIIVAGGTGFIGSALVRELIRKGHELVLLSRTLRKNEGQGPRYLEWDGKSLGPWAEEIETADALINLSGEPVAAKRWSASRKEVILQSRVLPTRVLVDAMSGAVRKPKVLINASAAGFYGDVPDGDIFETSPKGSGFLAETCGQWEKEALRAEALGVRTVLLRTGIVIGKNGGALSKMVPPFLFFAGGPLGSGRQWVPWIHRQDLVNIIFFALENGAISGPVNAASPCPVTMRDLCGALGEVLQRPSWLPVPSFVLRMMLGEMSGMLLGGQKAVPKALLDHHFVFQFPDVRAALREVLH